MVLILLGAASLGRGLYLPAKAQLAQVLLRRAWALSESGPVRPWPWARSWPVARLCVPRLGIDEIVLAGDEGATLAFAPGHSDASCSPEGRGNIVISGHRDTVFSFLSKLRWGDRLLLETPSGRTRAFTVVATSVVDEKEVSALLPTPDPVLTLITCYPFDAIRPGGPLRYIVRAVEEEEDDHRGITPVSGSGRG